MVYLSSLEFPRAKIRNSKENYCRGPDAISQRVFSGIVAEKIRARNCVDLIMYARSNISEGRLLLIKHNNAKIYVFL